MSEAYDPDNLLDRHTSQETMELQYAHMYEREADLLGRRLGVSGGDVVSVGCGWHPGRHVFPAPAWRMTAVDMEPAKPQHLVEQGTVEAGVTARAGELPFEPHSFDVVLYRLVLHHIAFQGPLRPVFEEAARLLRPGGALVAVEPGAWHPIGAGLTLANSLHLGTAVHGTPDDIPLSPRLLMREARAVGLQPELHAVTFAWRRMPPALQRALWPVDCALGSRRRSAYAGHTLLLVARRVTYPGSGTAPGRS